MQASKIIPGKVLTTHWGIEFRTSDDTHRVSGPDGQIAFCTEEDAKGMIRVLNNTKPEKDFIEFYVCRFDREDQ